MIKANELRLENYIKSGINGAYDEKGIIGKVLEIGNEERDFEQIYCECDESFEWFFKGNYFGIKLTEEWLLKFGFIDHGSCFNLSKRELLGHDFGDFAVSKYDDTQMKVWRGNRYIGVCHIEFVHHLQNLYFALTGEELTIKK
jgi:hypothetical protein